MTCNGCSHFKVCAVKSKMHSTSLRVNGKSIQNDYIENVEHKCKHFVPENKCKVGDTVYVLGEQDIAELTITVIEINGYDNLYHAKCKSNEECTNPYDPCMAEEEICYIALRGYDFGKKAFLEKKDAEEAIERRDNK